MHKIQISAKMYNSFSLHHTQMIQGLVTAHEIIRRPAIMETRVQSQNIARGICGRKQTKGYVLNNFSYHSPMHKFP
jgi:hypothetical protein